MILVATGGSLCGLGSFLILRSALFNVRPARSSIGEKLRKAQKCERGLLGISDDAYSTMFLAHVLLGAIGAVAVLLILNWTGLGLSPLLSTISLIAGMAFSAAILFQRIEKQSVTARRVFSYALSSYLDLAGVLLAGGAGSETALVAAARTGRSWSFRLIREALDKSRAGRVPPWRAFADLGKRHDIVDLERLSGSMQLAGEQGARVRQSLAAQAEALRVRQMSEVEAEAQDATERMGIPTVLLFVGFIALLGYPALDLVVGQM